jgi:hypothetical protein
LHRKLKPVQINLLEWNLKMPSRLLPRKRRTGEELAANYGSARGAWPSNGRTNIGCSTFEADSGELGLFRDVLQRQSRLLHHQNAARNQARNPEPANREAGYSRCLKHEFQIVEGHGGSDDRNESGSGERSQGCVSYAKRPEQQLSTSLQTLQLIDAQQVSVLPASNEKISAATMRVRSTTLAIRLLVPRQRTDEAFVNIAGATTAVKTAKGLSVIHPK